MKMVSEAPWEQRGNSLERVSGLSRTLGQSIRRDEFKLRLQHELEISLDLSHQHKGNIASLCLAALCILCTATKSCNLGI